MEHDNLNELDEAEYEDEDLENIIPSKNNQKENPMDNLKFKTPGQKQKRRSKNDYKGRDYHCGCGKTYLSYPALYTHIKSKHNGKPPDGTNANQIENKIKGRGRPRKNFLINEDNTRKRGLFDENPLEELHPQLQKLYGKNSLDNKSYKKREKDYFNIYTYISEYFDIDYQEYSIEELFEGKNLDNDENYKILYDKINYWNKKNNEYIEKTKFITNPGVTINNIISNNIDNDNLEFLNKYNTTINETIKIPISEMKNNRKNFITCDDAIALFMIEYKENLVISLMKLFLLYFYYLRKYLNRIGWDYILELQNDVSMYKTENNFTSESNPSLIPELVKDFLAIYLPKNCPQFKLFYASVLTNHFCDFLLMNDLTTLEINLIKACNYYNDSHIKIGKNKEDDNENEDNQYSSNYEENNYTHFSGLDESNYDKSSRNGTSINNAIKNKNHTNGNRNNDIENEISDCKSKSQNNTSYDYI